MHTITVDGRNWVVKIGRDCMDPRSRKTKLVVPLNDSTGRSWDSIKRGRHKKTTVVWSRRARWRTPPARHWACSCSDQVIVKENSIVRTPAKCMVHSR
jgi:hypothetical protein